MRSPKAFLAVVILLPLSCVLYVVLQPQGNQQSRFVVANRISSHISAGRKAKIRRWKLPARVWMRDDIPLSIQEGIPACT